MVYPYNVILFSNKRNEVLIHAIAWTNLKSIMLSETSQSQTATYVMITLLCDVNGRVVPRECKSTEADQRYLGLRDLGKIQSNLGTG